MNQLPSVVAAAAGLIGWVAPVTAQVLRDLPPIRLQYDVFLNDAAEPCGSASLSYEFSEGARGRRLEVHALSRYTVGDEAPIELLHEARLTCDGEGVEKFDGRTRYGGEERRYVGVRIDIDYHVTVHQGEKVTQRTETAGVQRTNWGLFCGGFLEERLGEGEMMQDYPMLFPSSGRHFPRQKFRSGRVPVTSPSGESFPVIETSFARVEGDWDEAWHRDDPHEILLRMKEHGPLGLVTYELTAVDGKPVDWAVALGPRAPREAGPESSR
jgi:hypothetical protein